MNSNSHPNGAPQTSRLANVFNTLIGSGAIACEMALLTPPASHRVENGGRPGASRVRADAPRTIDVERPLRTIGGGR